MVPFGGSPILTGSERHSFRMFGYRRKGSVRGCPPGKVFFSGLGGCLSDLIEDHVQKISSVRLDFPVITDDSLRPRIFPDRIRIQPEEIDEGHRDLSCVSSEIPVLLPRLFPERKARLKTSDKFYPVEVGVGYRGVFCPPGCAVEDGAFDRESPDPLRKPGSMIPCQDENRLVSTQPPLRHLKIVEWFLTFWGGGGLDIVTAFRYDRGTSKSLSPEDAI